MSAMDVQCFMLPDVQVVQRTHCLFTFSSVMPPLLCKRPIQTREITATVLRTKQGAEENTWK